MSAKIYYLHPFQQESLQPSSSDEEAGDQVISDASEVPETKRKLRRPMPGGRKSKWKKKIGGGAVPRDATPTGRES